MHTPQKTKSNPVLFVIFSMLLIIPAYPGYAQIGIPPVQWGEPGVRENMLETTDRWRSDSNTPLPSTDIATHGPRVPAFPGAEGYGAWSFGGRGGKLIRVSNLNDSGPGSLREAVQKEGPRIVVFDVSGTIELLSPIRVYHPYLTIAGQTAPGGGITVAGNQFDIRTYDVILRHMRFRHGVDPDLPPPAGNVDEWTLRVRSANHVILDHVTITWGMDGNLGVTFADNVTVQNSTLSKPLEDSGHFKGNRAYGALVRGRHGARYSFLSNLWANHRARVPRPGNYVPFYEDPHGLLMDFRNNVIFDGVGANYDDDSVTKYNFVNNYMLTNWRLIERSPYTQGHFSGNIKQGVLVEDQWSLLDPGGSVSRANHEQSEPFDPGEVMTFSAEEAWERVMESAGPWIRDEHDQYVIQEILNFHRVEFEGGQPEYTLPDWWKTGRIDFQYEVGGLPALKEMTVPIWIDTNRNGIPDWWEEEQGLDSSDPGLAGKDNNGNGYTNLEDYLNDLEAIRKTHEIIADAYQEPCFTVAPQVSHVDHGSARFLWVTPEGTPAGQVNLELLAGGAEQSLTATLSTPGFQNRRLDELDYLQQRVSFDGLQSHTAYHYEVECGDGETKQTGTFLTSPEPGQETPVQFSVIADGHATGGMYGSIADAVADLEPDFVVHAGGQIGGMGNEWDKWVRYFQVARPILENSIIFPVAGKIDAQPARNFRGLFGFNDPETQDPALEDDAGTWYNFTYGNLEFFVFDWSRDLPSQLEWAVQVLEQSQADWKIVSYHYPEPGVGGRGQVFEASYSTFFDLFEEHGVDLVFYGGNYLYERLLPVGTEGNKPVHYISVNSGDSFRQARPSPIVKGGIGAMERVLIHVTVAGDILELEALRDDGTVIDRLELIKGEDGAYQAEIMEQAIDIDLARKLAHIFTGQSMTEDLRNERRDRAGEFTVIPPVAGESVGIRLHTGYIAGAPTRNVSRFPIGSKLVVHEQTGLSGWRTDEQVIEITGDIAQLEAIAPQDLVVSGGGVEPAPELRVHLRMNGRDFDPVTLRPAMADFATLDQVELLFPSQLRMVSTQPEFAWKAIAHASEYHVQVGESNLANIVVDTTVTHNELLIPYELKPEQAHRWRVRGMNQLGEGPWSEEILFFTGQSTSVDEDGELPREFALGHNYPNPFNPSTTIRYSLPVHAHVNLRVYDIIGREVRVLVNGEQQAGHHHIVFDSASLASGVYQYRLEAIPESNGSEHGRFVRTRSMTLIK